MAGCATIVGWRVAGMMLDGGFYLPKWVKFFIIQTRFLFRKTHVKN
ncbi:hypothetical protein [Moraxella lacunata]